LAEKIVATHSLPPFDNSAMDGYAVYLEDAGKTLIHRVLFLQGQRRYPYGRRSMYPYHDRAKIPTGCEAIVPIEEVRFTEEKVSLPHTIKASQHIRLKGEDIQSAFVTEKGTRLHAIISPC